ncbi:hypothetical protein [Aquimarina pacifica]|uniref:hypothetical protein n=1 Tax=Aquimarina pacifica TaxID=1296415 RepID=UPI00046E93D4|nr:hypothetical protein [Aquimarina pacifica]
MSSGKNNIATIKSVNIRLVGIKRQGLITSDKVALFESFLKETIGNEVLVVNTNIGVGVYYYSFHDYSTFIRESALLYIISSIDHKKLRFKNNRNREEVYQSFCEALITFSQYPQIFLAYSKKFIFLKEKNQASKFVIPVLNVFFEEVLKELIENGKMPHHQKIKKVQNKSNEWDTDSDIIKDLISEILLKQHHN